MPTTSENLSEAFAGESQAYQRYVAFAVQAEKEGFAQVAKLFRATAYAEKVHAGNHLRAAAQVKTTRGNLESAIKGETFEFEQMYPKMIETAKTEGNSSAARSFEMATKAEKTHAGLYQNALDNLGSNPASDIYVCSFCGETIVGSAPDTCPVCFAKKELFIKID